MSSPWSWFGGSSAQKRKESSRNAIISLRGQLELLQKREKRLQSQIDEQYAIARANANTNKTGKKSLILLSSYDVLSLVFLNAASSGQKSFRA